MFGISLLSETAVLLGELGSRGGPCTTCSCRGGRANVSDPGSEFVGAVGFLGCLSAAMRRDEAEAHFRAAIAMNA